MKEYEYRSTIEWTGNGGAGTSTKAYGRDSEISSPGKPTFFGSAPVEFGGDGFGWSPEELFVAAVSQCHMLTYLFVCQRAGIVVQSYVDRATGTLRLGADGGSFVVIRLRPEVSLSVGDPARAAALHDDASKACYVGSSVSCPIEVDGTVTLLAADVRAGI